MQKEIPGFDGKYLIDDTGHVWSNHCNRYLSRQLNKVNGYYYCNLWKNNKLHNKPVHRLIAEAFVPNPQNKPVVNHIDGNKLNNFPSNLEWVTKQENETHARATGLRTYTNRLSLNQFITVLWDVIRGESYASVSARVPYKVPFLSTKLRQIAKEQNIEHLLDESLRQQRCTRAQRNLESINN